MPYASMVRSLQAQLEKERNPRRKRDLETMITVLLGIIEIRDKIDNLVDNAIKRML